MRPALLVIAGPNGSGKTTVTVRLRQERWSDGVEYLNPTTWRAIGRGPELARCRTSSRRLDYGAPRGAARQRARDCFRDGPLRAGQDRFRRSRPRYFVRVFFIGTSDARINAARVAGQVIQGGHTVPIEKIVTRYARSIANLSAVLRIADRTYVYDNSIDGQEARLCARTIEGQLRGSASR